MNESEANTFERNSLFETSLLMRKWDELAKETNLPLIPLVDIKAKAIKILANKLKSEKGVILE